MDYNTPTSGYVDISYVGDMPSVKILDHNRRLQEVPATGGPKSVNLPNTWAFAFDFVSLRLQASLVSTLGNRLVRVSDFSL